MIEESLLKNVKLNTEFKVDLDLKKNKKKQRRLNNGLNETLSRIK